MHKMVVESIMNHDLAPTIVNEHNHRTGNHAASVLQRRLSRLWVKRQNGVRHKGIAIFIHKQLGPGHVLGFPLPLTHEFRLGLGLFP